MTFGRFVQAHFCLGLDSAYLLVIGVFAFLHLTLIIIFPFQLSIVQLGVHVGLVSSWFIEKPQVIGGVGDNGGVYILWRENATLRMKSYSTMVRLVW